MPWIYGILIGAAGVVIAQLILNYSLSDFLKDAVLRLFGRVASLAEARAKRAEATLARLRGAL
jgi:hypothetical protein